VLSTDFGLGRRPFCLPHLICTLVFRLETQNAVFSENSEYMVVDVVSVLTDSDYQTGRKYWKVLKGRLKDEGSQLATNCYKLKMTAPDGKQRHWRPAGDVVALQLRATRLEFYIKFRHFLSWTYYHGHRRETDAPNGVSKHAARIFRDANSMRIWKG
jgi:hypothetical protein